MADKFWLWQCEQCGVELDGTDGYLPVLIHKVKMCDQCAEDYRFDHPDWEQLVAEAEYNQDCRKDR